MGWGILVPSAHADCRDRTTGWSELRGLRHSIVVLVSPTQLSRLDVFGNAWAGALTPDPRGGTLTREALAGDGPLFNHARADELGPALKRALRALDEDEKGAP